MVAITILMKTVVKGVVKLNKRKYPIPPKRLRDKLKLKWELKKKWLKKRTKPKS